MSFDRFHENSDDFDSKIMERIRKIMEEIDKAAKKERKQENGKSIALTGRTSKDTSSKAVSAQAVPQRLLAPLTL